MTTAQQIALIEHENAKLRALTISRRLERFRRKPWSDGWMTVPKSNSLREELRDIWAGRKLASL